MAYNLNILLILCSYLLTSPVFGQIEIIQDKEIIENLREIYNFTINNLSEKNFNLRFEASIEDKGTIIYQSTSGSILIIPGLNSIRYEKCMPVKVLKNLQNLQNELLGKYKIRLRALDELNIVRSVITFSSDYTTNKLESQSNSRWIRTNGSVNLSSQVSIENPNNSQVPRNYLRLEAYPNLSIKDIPVGLNLLISTEESGRREALNQFSFYFDYKQLAENLKAKLQEHLINPITKNKILQDSIIKLKSAKIINNKFPEFERSNIDYIKSQIDSFQVMQRQLTNYNSVLANPEIAKMRSRFQILNAKVNFLTENEKLELESLRNAVKELENLKKIKEILENRLKESKKIKSLANNYSKYIDYKNIGIFKDPTIVKSSLKKLSQMPKFISSLENIKSFQLGTSFPYFSKYTLNGLGVDGINLEISPKNFYLNILYGSTSREHIDSTFLIPQINLKQKTIGIKFGYGHPQQTHIHLFMVDIKDNIDNLLLIKQKSPQQNRMIGLNFLISGLKNKLQLKTEAAGSLITKDRRLTNSMADEYNLSQIPVKFILPKNINASSGIDYTASIMLKINASKSTFITSNYDYIGANYTSLGAFGILNNVRRIKIELRQNIFSNQLSFHLYARKDERDNTGSISSLHSELWNYGFQSIINFKKLPSFTFNFNPSNYNFNNSREILKSLNLNSVITYPLAIGKNINTTTSFQFVNQKTNSGLISANYKYTLLSITELVQSKYFGFMASYSFYPKFTIDTVNFKQNSLDLSVNFNFFKKYSAIAGFQQVNLNLGEFRKSLYVEVSTNIISNLGLRIRLNKFDYKLIGLQNGIDQYGQMFLNYAW